MNQERILKVLRAAHVSEKATVLADQNGTFVFKVAKDANKLEIKKAVEALFEVKVKAVRTANMKGKSKFFGRVAGKRADWKKAYVSLEEGQDIDFLGAE
ncbi:MAG: large subunit ribosomal protein L23 [Alcanivorax sp.]|jgi:large subunit ribosomal protein L23|uniref:Large ribosomal subunit protein uL23 n=1 Tax=Alcanivorax jadensis T9 TaxID=1177181 RepID=A0ABR4W980_9GAMM|nr:MULTISPECIES: 50S ribosomal protein L23 [Alcanivorax]KGD59960.1 50S ribosomal protein L23 [Alcanivorax jadensis T9]MAC15286.1 50S ribosomal protein L23 [Alcanivorax sp.]MDF1639278.1 50S ribosomal protein L23 [Alcanivorax jadensis]|tara:strand:- start:18714 stop:19010 length:297 start_codon:yes stop_codon:yes gene_type:complete|mmetsp:Transcript_11221/g.36957  ORF Transcript_11221/g.36957 Transcript_11221/m.36957 type:complete len:99 (+) Transcript_11221:1850-2146(+)